MHRPLSSLFAKLLVAAFMALACATFVACGDEEEDPCSEEGRSVSGIQGKVMSPSCEAAVVSATVVARHSSGATLTMDSGADGSFAFSGAEVQEGNWQISASKGPFDSNVAYTSVSGSKSTFVIVLLR